METGTYDLWYDATCVGADMVVECWTSHGPRADDSTFDPKPGDHVVLGDGDGPSLQGWVLRRDGDASRSRPKWRGRYPEFLSLCMRQRVCTSVGGSAVDRDGSTYSGAAGERQLNARQRHLADAVRVTRAPNSPTLRQGCPRCPLRDLADCGFQRPLPQKSTCSRAARPRQCRWRAG